MSTSASLRGHRRSGSEEIVQQPVQQQPKPSAINTYFNNLGTSVTGIALLRITGMQNYIRTPEKVKEGLYWVHKQLNKIGIPGAAAQEVPPTTQPTVVTNGEPTPAPAPQQPVAPNGEPTPPPSQPAAPAAHAAPAPQQPVTPTAAAPNGTETEATAGAWSRFKDKVSYARSGASNFGNSIVEHFSVNRGWYGRAVGFAATYHALNYAVDRFASHKIKNETLRRAVSFGLTTAFVWTAAVYVFKQEISGYDVVDTGMQVLISTKVLQFGVPYIKAGYAKLPNPLALLSFRSTEVLKEKNA